MRKWIILLLLCLLGFGQRLTAPADTTLNRITYEQEQIKLNLNKAGKQLTGARGSFFTGLLLNIAGTTLILVADDTEDTKFALGIGCNAIGFICQCFSWFQIGSAGQNLKTEK